MAFDRSPQLTLFADKIAVRDYVADRVGSMYLTKAYLTVEKGEKIDWSVLPTEFVAKVNHACGGNVIVSQAAPASNRLPKIRKKHQWGTINIAPDQLETAVLESLLDSWMDRNYSWELGRAFPEWAYSDIRPGAIFEEFLIDESGGSVPTDYKFFCIQGHVRVVQVVRERLTEARRWLVSPQWFPVEASLVSATTGSLPPQPVKLSEMIQIAETLSQGTDFLRVDLYEIGDRIIFGELTNYPYGGGTAFFPKSFDVELGKF